MLRSLVVIILIHSIPLIAQSNDLLLHPSLVAEHSITSNCSFCFSTGDTQIASFTGYYPSTLATASVPALNVPGADMTSGGLSLAAVTSSNALAASIPLSEPSAPTHSFFDRQNVIGFTVHAAVRVADTTQTCILLARPNRRESWLPMQSCAAVTGYSLSMVAAQIGTSYGLHHTGYHALERWLPYIWASPSAAAIAVSLKAW